MKPNEIKLKEPEKPPWKWWFLIMLTLTIALAAWVVTNRFDQAARPDSVPEAAVVDPQDPASMQQALRESHTVYRVDPQAERKSELYPQAITNYFESHPPRQAEHPLDPALEVARKGLQRLAPLHDYTATIIKQERIGGELSRRETMNLKIRRHRDIDQENTVPFGVYLNFTAPKAVAGREVIWVEGANQGKLIVHETGLLNLMPFHLDPNGSLAMSGSRYPITEIGFDVLITRMIEKATRDRGLGECEVRVNRWVELDQRPCTKITLLHTDKNPQYDFYRAEIVIDDELNLPVKYAAWDWPESENEPPPLLESYTYLNVQLDVGLSDQDFDPENPDYNF